MSNVFNKKACDKLLAEFGVNTEEELEQKLLMESFIINCIVCNKLIPIEKAHYIDGGDPVCGGCYGTI